jgi:hypothetical protein
MYHLAPKTTIIDSDTHAAALSAAHAAEAVRDNPDALLGLAFVKWRKEVVAEIARATAQASRSRSCPHCEGLVHLTRKGPGHRWHDRDGAIWVGGDFWYRKDVKRGSATVPLER